jgi:hypothetical protein
MGTNQSTARLRNRPTNARTTRYGTVPQQQPPQSSSKLPRNVSSLLELNPEQTGVTSSSIIKQLDTDPTVYIRDPYALLKALNRVEPSNLVNVFEQILDIPSLVTRLRWDAQIRIGLTKIGQDAPPAYKQVLSRLINDILQKPENAPTITSELETVNRIIDGKIINSNATRKSNSRFTGFTPLPSGNIRGGTRRRRNKRTIKKRSG